MPAPLRFVIFMFFTGGALFLGLITMANADLPTNPPQAEDFYEQVPIVIGGGFCTLASAVIAAGALAGLLDTRRTAAPAAAVLPPVPPQGHVPSPMQQQLPPSGVPYPGAPGPQQPGQPGQPA
ncbi:hypothetical protein [Thermomonospora catenispora]|uniref:hypothetical protein n=1 Tax=Thermomonospora catenispora TaxID=2493090 RepID=UPI001120B396|nr:hypothetical protein [Thermomonospora catenispora]TNY38565.1 hypothetical protein EIO00_03135 [Thermomonospora catenispora]